MNPFLLASTASRRLAPLMVASLFFAAVLSFAAALSFAAGASAADDGATSKGVDPAFRQAIREYVEIQGPAEMTGQTIAYGMAEQTLQAIAQTGAEVTEPMQQIVLGESLATFGKKFSDVDYLTDLWAPIYAEHFSEAEIRQLVAFYKSPVGSKTLELMVPISQAGNERLQEATFAIAPGFQLAVDAKLREAGISVTP